MKIPGIEMKTLSHGTQVAELNTRSAGRVEEIRSMIEDLHMRAAEACIPAVREVLGIAHAYDERIVGLSLEPLWDEVDLDLAAVEVEFLLNEDGGSLTFEDYRPGAPYSSDRGFSGGEIPRGLHSLYSVLVRLGYTYFQVHEHGCECSLTVSVADAVEETGLLAPEGQSLQR